MPSGRGPARIEPPEGDGGAGGGGVPTEVGGAKAATPCMLTGGTKTGQGMYTSC